MSEDTVRLMERLKEWCLDKRAELQRGVDAFETGRRSFMNEVDTTQETAEREKAQLADLDKILAEWPTTRP